MIGQVKLSEHRHGLWAEFLQILVQSFLVLLARPSSHFDTHYSEMLEGAVKWSRGGQRVAMW